MARQRPTVCVTLPSDLVRQIDDETFIRHCTRSAVVESMGRLYFDLVYPDYNIGEKNT